MRHILITGGTGLVGQELTKYYLHNGDHVIILTRGHRQSEHDNLTYFNWQEDNWEEKLPKIDIIINLAGASLSKRWTKDHKDEMLLSRVQTTERLYQYFDAQNYAPDVLFNASAIGYYPPSKSAEYDEYDIYDGPHDFLSLVVHEWEGAAQQFESLGTRILIGRLGVVFSKNGGALDKMILPYKLFAGGNLADGKQWFSWIHLHDVVRAITELIENEQAQGVYNICSPKPIRQRHLGKLIGRILGRPHWAPVPSPILRVVLGEQATIILDVQKVLPTRLVEEEQFSFHYPTALLALEDILSEN